MTEREKLVLKGFRLPSSLIEKLEQYFAKNPTKTKEKCAEELLEYAVDIGLRRGLPHEQPDLEGLERSPLWKDCEEASEKVWQNHYSASEILEARVIIAKIDQWDPAYQQQISRAKEMVGHG